MRLSRPRILIRVVLLLWGGLYMLAFSLKSAKAVPLGEHVRVHLVAAILSGLLGLLALVTATFAAFTLRARPRGSTLHLEEPSPLQDERPGQEPDPQAEKDQ